MPVAVKQMVEGAMNEDDFIDEAKNMRWAYLIYGQRECCIPLIDVSNGWD